MKKVLLVVLTVCLLLSTLPAVTATEESALVEVSAPARAPATGGSTLTKTGVTLNGADTYDEEDEQNVSCGSPVELGNKKEISEIPSEAKPLEPSVPVIYDPPVSDEPTADLGLFRTLGNVNRRPAFGIDVSFAQGYIDWETAAQYIDFAIIRCGYGVDIWYQDDEYWEYNVSECERLGIPYGVYLYSYSQSPGQSISEASHVARLLEGHHPTLPVYLDLEDINTVGQLDPDTLLENVCLFCDGVEAAGYQPGIYACLSWELDRLYSDEYERWPRWVAQWEMPYCENPMPYVMWQYGWDYVPGIGVPVDVNYLYSGIMPGEDEWHCSGGPECPGYGFVDMPALDSWKHEGIDFCIEHGLMNGVSEHVFSPDTPVTRGQIVAVFHRLANSPEKEYEGRFSDVECGEWYTQAVEWAAKSGIVKGVSEKSFHPRDSLTREQMATILYRCVGSPEVDGDLSRFADAENVSAYAYNAMVWATSEGIINGIADGRSLRLCPTDCVTRAQLASIIMRCMK